MNKHLLLVVVAILVGLIHILPHIIFYKTTVKDRVYYPINFSELVYAAQVNEIVSGHIGIGDPQLFEHKNVFPPINPYIPIAVVALLSLFLHSIPAAFFLSDFIFPLILFVIIYKWVYKISKNSYHAIFSSVFTIFMYSLLTNFPPVTIDLLGKFIKKILLTDISTPLAFARTPNPQISFIILVLSLIGLYNFLLKPNAKNLVIFTALGVSLFSTYFYHATFFFFAVVSMFPIYAIKKEYKICKLLIIAIFILTLAALIYKIVSGNPPYNTSQLMAGYFQTRYIDWVFTARYAAMLGVIVFIFKGIKNNVSAFFVGLSVAAIISVNFQLLTGWTFQPGHWPQTTIEPVMAIAACILFYELFKKRNFNKLYLVSTIFILLFATIYQIKFSQKYKDMVSITQKNNEVIGWIENNTTDRDVVLSLDVVSNLVYVSAYTKANIFFPIYDYHYASLDEVWMRLLFAYKMYGMDISNTNLMSLPSAQYSLDQAYNINAYKHFPLNEYPQAYVDMAKNCLPSICSGYYVIPASVDKLYKSLYTTLDSVKNPFKITYIIYSDYERNMGAQPPRGSIVFDNGDAQIFKVPSSNLHD